MRTKEEIEKEIAELQQELSNLDFNLGDIVIVECKKGSYKYLIRVGEKDSTYVSGRAFCVDSKDHNINEYQYQCFTLQNNNFTKVNL